MSPDKRALVERGTGLLLPVRALPGPGKQGDFDGAMRAIDLLADAGVRVWQVLPLGPTHPDNSPYLSLSAHAGNPDLIGLDLLREILGWPTSPNAGGAGEKVQRHVSLQRAWEEFRANPVHPWQDDYRRFLATHGGWLDDYALFIAIRESRANAPWLEWPPLLRDRDPAALAQARRDLAGELELIRFVQFVFFQQWVSIRSYAASRDVLIFGDMPFFVAMDSAEVWAHRRYFLLDEKGAARAVAGVPPDYFSPTGQRWGNPLYNWERLAEDGFQWWIDRVRTQRVLYDLVRLDHFRALCACWHIPAEAETAENGSWQPSRGEALLKALFEYFEEPALVAEDLGIITEDVVKLRRQFRIPGMRVLQFGFDGHWGNPNFPDNVEEDCVVYTGTHDNDTSLAWYEGCHWEERQRIDAALSAFQGQMPWPIIECALACRAGLAVLPIQDLLGLGAGHRYNTPGTMEGNWHWRFAWDDVDPERVQRLLELNQRHGRI
jgi:4-alpha-glucanotransferase